MQKRLQKGDDQVYRLLKLISLQSEEEKDMQGAKDYSTVGSIITPLEAIPVIEHKCKNISDEMVRKVAQLLFPMPLGNSPHEGLDLAIKSFYQIKIKSCRDPEEFKVLLSEKVSQCGDKVKTAINDLLSKDDYFNYLQNSVKSKMQKGAKDVIEISDSPQPQVKDKHSVKTLPVRKKERSRPSKMSKSDPKKMIYMSRGSQVEQVVNLSGKGICLCGLQVVPLEDTFACLHCSNNYHYGCMKRSLKVRHCSYCHLTKLLPHKEVKKTLFMGLLKKNIKKHELEFCLQPEDLNMKYKLQVRCFRLSEKTQTFILFPDSFQFVVNGFSVKVLDPLHKQSSLKYRKDEPFTVQQRHLLSGDNKVSVIEKLGAKELKDMRTDAQFHLIGLFLIADKSIEQLVKQISLTSVTSQQDSKKLLQLSFASCDPEGQISCEVVKISLLCHLSSQRMKVPVRGLFCTHLMCFDLVNFLVITSKSASLRWVCPQCKLPCYEFRIDSLLLSILEEYSEHPVTEILFFKTGAFSVSTGQGYIQNKISNINDLPVDSLVKRAASNFKEPPPKKKRVGSIPQHAKIITLD